MTIDERFMARRAEILRLAASHGARNIRIFGSVARGEADELIQSWMEDLLATMREA